jgi:hypothetical protein
MLQTALVVVLEAALTPLHMLVASGGGARRRRPLGVWPEAAARLATNRVRIRERHCPPLSRR